MWRFATTTPMLSATACSFSKAISPQPSALRSHAELLCVPGEAQFARRRHVTNQRRRGDDDGAGEIAFAAEPHAVLPVAVERRDRALSLLERVGTLSEPGPGA